MTLGLVNVSPASDLTLKLYRTDSTGVLLGSPLAVGSLTAQQVAAFAHELPSTPVYLPVLFDEAFSQQPGEFLAFVIDPNPMSFYYGSGNAYGGGRMLSDPSKDIVFSTMVVPEPEVKAFLALAILAWLEKRRFKLSPHRR